MADTAVSNNEQIVNEFIAAFGRLDLEGLMNFFTEDAVYHNMPWPSANGHAAIRKVIVVADRKRFGTGMFPNKYRA